MVKQLFTEQEKQDLLKKKAIEIREEFFQTYVPIQNAEESQKKKLMKKVPWNEHMTATSDDKILIDPSLGNEEAQREVQIYQITFANVQRSIGYLTQEGIPVQRPDDFEVEMFKSPKQMDKIKLKIEKKRDDKNKKEEEKMKKHSKKLNKQMRIKKMREEHKEKRSNKVAIEQWKKEIKEKGSEKARDLDEIIKENNQKPKKFRKDKNQQQDGVKKNGMFKQKNGNFKKTGKMRTQENSFQNGGNRNFGQRSQSSDANGFRNNKFEGKPQRSRSFSGQGGQRNNGGDKNHLEGEESHSEVKINLKEIPSEEEGEEANLVESHSEGEENHLEVKTILKEILLEEEGEEVNLVESHSEGEENLLEVIIIQKEILLEEEGEEANLVAEENHLEVIMLKENLLEEEDEEANSVDNKVEGHLEGEESHLEVKIDLKESLSEEEDEEANLVDNKVVGHLEENLKVVNHLEEDNKVVSQMVANHLESFKSNNKSFRSKGKK
ncbi:unnamed protein product [Paramecium pentaurelia]|uniref:Uncharacterized protein n=1 Tax=Paramecium pentaurelia TaxID=43138 RepID=A0A8S1S7C4_9CILI|nr:unnamed protein product [Paramecium pentaurelia]